MYEDFGNFAMVHISQLIGPRGQLTITATTEGLHMLISALVDAISRQSEGTAELYCSDTESYEVRVIRLDDRDEWDDVPLPYQQVSDNLSVEMAEY
jgi:hypothetical protein